MAAPPLDAYRFDFGTSSSALATDYLRVTKNTAYNAAVGYGWQSAPLGDLDRGTGTALTQDLHYGRSATFNGARQVCITQFKYSIGKHLTDFKASDAKKTVIKFAAAYLDYRRKYGGKSVRSKLVFELITNRPIYPALEQAVAGIRLLPRRFKR